MHTSRVLGIFAVFLVSLFLALVILTGFSQVSATEQTATGQAHLFLAPTIAPNDGPWVVVAYFSNREQVNRVAERIEPWEVNYDQGFMVLEVDKDHYQWLLEL
ncbi:MAG TPA: hypothetical protein VIS10_02830, partial [Anaerolineales bacterium]